MSIDPPFYDTQPSWGLAPEWATHMMRRTPTPTAASYCFARKEGDRYFTCPKGTTDATWLITEDHGGWSPWEEMEARPVALATPALGPGAQLDQRVGELARLLQRMVFENDHRARAHLGSDELDKAARDAFAYLHTHKLVQRLPGERVTVTAA